MRSISRRGFIASERRRARRAAARPLDRRARASHQSGLPPRRGQRRSAERSRHPVDARDAEARPARRRVSWMLARDPKLAQIVARGEPQTGAARDFTVKIDATGLEPAHDLLLPLRIDRRAIGDRPHANAAGARRGARPPRRGVVLEPAAGLLQRLRVPREARRPRRDAAPRRLHLRVSRTSNTATARRSAAFRRRTRKWSRCSDYRERHAQYKADPDSQAIHRQHPFIVTWDDHEFANNTWKGGAENHNPDDGEGDWRRAAPRRVQAYFEWMPIREDAQTLHVAHLSHVPIRRPRHAVHARHAPDRPRSSRSPREDIAAIEHRRPQLLGAAQEGWLAEQFADVGAQQVDAGTCSASR